MTLPRWLLALVFVAGCTDASGVATSEPRVTLDGRDLHKVLEKESAPGAPDVCSLAAELPADNLCSLICDPDAMAARMIRDGWPTGECVDMRCELPGASVNVGICLPVPAP